MQRGGHFPGREVRGGKDSLGHDRVHVIGAENPFPVAQDPLELGDRVLDAAAGEIGIGQLLARGHGVGMPRSLDPFVVGQRAPIQRDGVVGPSRGAQRGGQFVPGAERVEAVCSQDPLTFADGILEDRNRCFRLASGDERVAKRDPGGDR
jgi:hypothetical protein